MLQIIQEGKLRLGKLGGGVSVSLIGSLELSSNAHLCSQPQQRSLRAGQNLLSGIWTLGPNHSLVECRESLGSPPWEKRPSCTPPNKCHPKLTTYSVESCH